MATYYLVATGNINAAAPFSATSGGAGGAGIPTTGDTILCDGNSGAANLTINAAISLAKLDCNPGVNGPFVGTITHGAFTLTITGSGAGALRFSPGMTYAPAGTTSLVTFTLTSGTAQFTSGGKNFAAITMNGAGGTVQQQDNLTCTAVANAIFTLTAGTWDCNNAAGYTLTVGLFAASGSTARTFIGAGAVTVGVNVGAGQTIFTLATATNLTWTLNSAAFIFNIGATGPGATVNFGAQTFNAVTFACNTRAVYVITSFTCASLTLNPGVTLEIASSSFITITGSVFNWNGSAAQPIAVVCTSSNSTTPINCNAPGGGQCSMNWVTIGGITVASTTGVAFTATNSTALWGSTATWLAFQNPLDGVTLPPAVATALWQDLLASADFGTANSVGALLKAIGNLQFTAPAIGRGTCAAGGTTTSVPTSAFTPNGASANQFANAVILFDAATATAALRGQRAAISASTNAANPMFTVSALTAAPAAGDTFSVL